MSPLQRLSQALGYQFREDALLEAAVTHRSAGGANNERLEFLGDAVVNLVIAEQLFRRHPDLAEGDLSRLRASLVRGGTLAELAGELNLGDCLRLGPGERKSGGARRTSILADALEAVLGAVYLDAGFEAAAAVIRRIFQRRLQDLPPVESLKDPKTRLQEYLQARGRPLPVYRVVDVSGQQHHRIFTVACELFQDGTSATGTGRSRRQAEQAAARASLESLADGG